MGGGSQVTDITINYTNDNYVDIILNYEYNERKKSNFNLK